MKLITEREIFKSLSRINVRLLLIQHNADQLRNKWLNAESVFTKKSSLSSFEKTDWLIRFLKLRNNYENVLKWKIIIRNKL